MWKQSGITYNKMLDQINKDWSKYVTALAKNLQPATPIDTGAARRAWRKL